MANDAKLIEKINKLVDAQKEDKLQKYIDPKFGEEVNKAVYLGLAEKPFVGCQGLLLEGLKTMPKDVQMKILPAFEKVAGTFEIESIRHMFMTEEDPELKEALRLVMSNLKSKIDKTAE